MSFSFTYETLWQLFCAMQFEHNPHRLKEFIKEQKRPCLFPIRSRVIKRSPSIPPHIVTPTVCVSTVHFSPPSKFIIVLDRSTRNQPRPRLNIYSRCRIELMNEEQPFSMDARPSEIRCWLIANKGRSIGQLTIGHGPRDGIKSHQTGAERRDKHGKC